MSQTPIVRPVSWLNAAIAFGISAVFVLIGFVIDRSIGALVGAGLYLALSLLLRRVIARHHRNAIRHCKRKEYDQAVADFQKSAAFFHDHEWIDRLRAITMLSAAGMRYREMALTCPPETAPPSERESLVVQTKGGQEMPRGKKFTAEQIIGKLREAEVGFAKKRCPAAVEHRRIRSRVAQFGARLRLYAVWLMFSPLPLLVQSPPLTETRTRVRSA